VPTGDDIEGSVDEPLAEEMVRRLGQVEEQVAEFHRRSAHRESVIDRLHEENQRLLAGLGKAVLEPVVADLIRLYDQLDREARRLGAEVDHNNRWPRIYVLVVTLLAFAGVVVLLWS
jgi:molecular chaperone GrpE (heat shock protein)